MEYLDRINSKPGCRDPKLGEQSTMALGREASPEVTLHRERCTACMLECVAFATLDQNAAPADDPGVKGIVDAVHQRLFGKDS